MPGRRPGAPVGGRARRSGIGRGSSFARRLPSPVVTRPSSLGRRPSPVVRPRCRSLEVRRSSHARSPGYPIHLSARLARVVLGASRCWTTLRPTCHNRRLGDFPQSLDISSRSPSGSCDDAALIERTGWTSAHRHRLHRTLAFSRSPRGLPTAGSRGLRRLVPDDTNSPTRVRCPVPRARSRADPYPVGVDARVPMDARVRRPTDLPARFPPKASPGGLTPRVAEWPLPFPSRRRVMSVDHARPDRPRAGP